MKNNFSTTAASNFIWLKLLLVCMQHLVSKQNKDFRIRYVTEILACWLDLINDLNFRYKGRLKCKKKISLGNLHGLPQRFYCSSIIFFFTFLAYSVNKFKIWNADVVVVSNVCRQHLHTLHTMRAGLAWKILNTRLLI